jgi:transporter family protein
VPAALLALLSAALFAGNSVAVRVALTGATAATIVVVSIGTNLTVLWVVAVLRGELGAALLPTALLFVGAGVLAPGLARLALYTAIDMVGVARSVVASNTTPLFAALGAAVFLHEPIDAALVLGTVAIVLGVALTSGTPAPAEARSSRTGLLLALSTAVLAAASIVLRKIGLAVIPHAALAGALTLSGALVGLAPLVALRWRREPLRTTRQALPPMLLAGLLSSGGFLTYFLALNLGAASRVTPLSNTTPLFAVLLLRFAFRHVETVTRRTLIGAALTVSGVILVIAG